MRGIFGDPKGRIVTLVRRSKERYNGDSKPSTAVTAITPIGGGSGQNYTTSQTYDSHGRLATTTFPGGFALTRVYSARGYLSQLKNGATAIQTINALDAFGNSIDETYANGVSTLRSYDPKSGRLTDVNTTKGSTVIQNDDYAWRSNGTLESRIANPATGLNSTRKESYTYDVLNRVTKAETYINSSNTRDLDYTYNAFGNITGKTSTLGGDVDVTGYAYGAGTAGPHAVTGATVAGVSRTLTYDSNGAVTKYDIAGTGDDKYIAYNASNQPTKIVIGSSLSDPTPVAKDEFAYGPNGRRYARKTTWQDGATTYTEQVAYIGPVEVITDNSSGSSQTITKTRLSPNVMHVKIVGTTTETFFEYAHRDHLGSLEAVTDASGNVLDRLAFEPFGQRKKQDWSANISASERDALLDVHSGHTRKARGFTGHEHLDRTGFIHMNGRLYDPVLGRFLSPDPIVQFPAFSQGWNAYSYVFNTSSSFTDPSGFRTEEWVSYDPNPYSGLEFALDVFQFIQANSGASYPLPRLVDYVASSGVLSYVHEIGHSNEPTGNDAAHSIEETDQKNVKYRVKVRALIVNIFEVSADLEDVEFAIKGGRGKIQVKLNDKGEITITRGGRRVSFDSDRVLNGTGLKGKIVTVDLKVDGDGNVSFSGIVKTPLRVWGMRFEIGGKVEANIYGVIEGNSGLLGRAARDLARQGERMDDAICRSETGTPCDFDDGQ